VTDPWTERITCRDEAFRALESTEAGLSSAEAKARRARYGKNQLVLHRTRSPLRMLAAEFTTPFPLLLLAASLLSFLAAYMSAGEGNYELIAIALLFVVVLNAVVSFLQNYKAEKLMISFLDFIPKSVALLRDGRKVVLDARELVPGDILLLQEGDKVPADGFVVAATDLLADESILTGESEARPKVVVAEGDEPAGRVLSGSTILRGTGRILVVRTGRFTSLGTVTTLTQGVKSDLTPMQKELAAFVRKITWVALAIGILFFFVGLKLGHPFWGNLVFVIGIIGANIPEGLLPTVTLALTQSSVRMSRQNAVVKHILSVETLGSTTVICTDKTGTLTLNRFHVEGFHLDGTDVAASDRKGFRGNRASRTAAEVMALCNDAIVTREEGRRPAFRGDPNEVALAEFVDGFEGFEKVAAPFERLASRSFTADARYMSTTHRTAGGKLYLTVKGAPEVVLSRCTALHSGGEVGELSPEERERLSRRASSFASDGLRVLALAYRVVDEVHAEAEGLVFAGLVTLSDPPRPEVPAAVAACKAAGIRIVVLSGDRAETASYLARKLGIVRTPRVIEGAELSAMKPEELAEALRNPEVLFARIAPEQKLSIVEAFIAMGEVVAVTGDGVNDAPALKRADIGISMGKRGTDVAKEASDIILLDDNFATIVKAVEEGRAVYDNIRKFIVYILTSNMPELLPFVAYAFLPIPLPMTVIQVLSIDLFTDILPAIGLGNEPPEPDLMRRPPRRRDERLVTARTFLRAYGFIGMTEATLAFAAFFSVLFSGGWSWGAPLHVSNPLYGQATGAFLATVIFCQVGNVMACRTNRESALPSLLRSNPWITVGVAVELLFILAVLHVPALGSLFSARPFGAATWLALAAAPFVVFLVEEGRKKLARKGARSLAA
jgi:sodium/potassium-transporting ATPase subunit alpha